VRKRVPEIQYLLASITDEQRREFGQLVDATVGQIENAQFLPRPGIRFPQTGVSPASTSAYALANQPLVETKLIRQPGASDLDWLDCLTTNEGFSCLRSSIAGVPCLCSEIDKILSWRSNRRERDSKFVELAVICASAAGQYWRVDNVRSFDEFLERKFRSPAQGVLPDGIHEHLTPIRKRELELIGWTKARELAKVARRDRQGFDCAPWVHKAHTMPREEFSAKLIAI